MAANEAKELVAQLFNAAGAARYSHIVEMFAWLTIWPFSKRRKIEWLRAQMPQLASDPRYRAQHPEVEERAALDEIERIITRASGQQASYADMMRETGKPRAEVKNLTNRLEAHDRIMRCGAGKFTLKGRGARYVRTATIDAIEDALKASSGPTRLPQIARATGLTRSKIDGAIHLHPDRIMLVGPGLYALPGTAVELAVPLGPAHLAILDYLSSVPEAPIGVIESAIPKARSTLYRALQDLVRVGKVLQPRHGIYALAPETVESATAPRPSTKYISPRTAIPELLQGGPLLTRKIIATIGGPRSTIDGAILHLVGNGRIVRLKRGLLALPSNR